MNMDLEKITIRTDHKVGHGYNIAEWFPKFLPKDGAKDAKFGHHLCQLDWLMCSNKIVLLDGWTDPVHKDVCFSLLGIFDAFQNLNRKINKINT